MQVHNAMGGLLEPSLESWPLRVVNYFQLHWYPYKGEHWIGSATLLINTLN